jgi:abortive infection bacteriophage resistance protein
MNYQKPHLTFEQQADLLLSRGMKADKQELVEKLRAVNYYRISGY